MYEFVAVDFDGTLCEHAFPEIGAPRQDVILFVKGLAALGSKIILYTCRENGKRRLLDEAVAFCEEQEIPLYAVNENPGNPYAEAAGLSHRDGRKLLADLYIDDKAIHPDEIERAMRGGWMTQRNGDGYSLVHENCPKHGDCSDCADCVDVLTERLAAYEERERVLLENVLRQNTGGG